MSIILSVSESYGIAISDSVQSRSFSLAVCCAIKSSKIGLEFGAGRGSAKEVRRAATVVRVSAAAASALSKSARLCWADWR